MRTIERIDREVAERIGSGPFEWAAGASLIGAANEPLSAAACSAGIGIAGSLDGPVVRSNVGLDVVGPVILEIGAEWESAVIGGDAAELPTAQNHIADAIHVRAPPATLAKWNVVVLREGPLLVGEKAAVAGSRRAIIQEVIVVVVAVISRRVTPRALVCVADLKSPTIPGSNVNESLEGIVVSVGAVAIIGE